MGNQFHIACWSGDVEKVRTWTSNVLTRTVYFKCGVFGVNALHIAVYRGYMDIISLLIKFYIPVNESSYFSVIDPLMKEVAEHTQGNKEIIIPYLNMLYISSEWYRFGFLPMLESQSVHEIVQQKQTFAELFELVQDLNCEQILSSHVLQNGPNSPLPGYPSHITPLRLAVIAKRVEFVKYLLSRGADHTIMDENGNTVLHIAARMGTVDVVQCLLDAGCSLSVVDKDSVTPFCSAAVCGSLPIITAMIKSTQFNIANVKLELAMRIIVLQNHFHIISSLVRLGVNVSTVHSLLEDSFPLLHLSSFGGYLSTVTKLLEYGADVQLTDRYMRQTALHFATISGAIDVIRPLINAGLSINEKDSHGNTAGDLAVFQCDMSFLSTLIEVGCDVNQTVGLFFDGSYLHVIVYLMHTFHNSRIEYKPTVHHLRALMSMGCDMHLADKFGRLPIHTAAVLNLGEAITCLVDCGCAVDVPDISTSEGMQPIHFAALYDSVKAIESISRLNGNLNASCTNLKLLPIHLAISSRSFKACFKLLELGASPIVSQFDGLTPMHLAALHTSTELIDALADCGCSVNINSDQDSELVPRWYPPLQPFDPSLCIHAFKPIHIAVAVKNVVALHKLLTLGAEVDAVCLNATPLHLASAIGFTEGVDVLLNFNANAYQPGPGGFTHLDSVDSPCLLATSPHIASRCGVDKDKPGPNSFTPLHLATLYGHTEVVRLLLSHNCNTELVTMEENNHGRLTPLHLASLLHCPEIVELLLQHNQKAVSSLTADGLSALHLSLLPSDVVMKHLLLSDSKTVIAPLSKEELASHSSPQSAVISLLLDHGCDVNTVSTSGYTAYDFAKMYGFDHILPILIKAGGKDRATLAIQEQGKQHNMEVQFLKDHLEAMCQWKGTTERRMQDLQSDLTRYKTMLDKMRSEMDAIKQQCSQSLSAPFHGDNESVKGFLELFVVSFMEDACAKEAAPMLRRRKVIPEAVETEIERAKDSEGANGHLYDHLCVQGTFECLKTVCDVFIRKKGYAKTNQLGERMKNELIRRQKY